jgi:hypothetical protein
MMFIERKLPTPSRTSIQAASYSSRLPPFT